MQIAKVLTMLALCVTPVAAPAQQPATDCPAKPALDYPWQDWTLPKAGMAGYQTSDARTLLLGSALEATLHPQGHMVYAAKPGKDGGAATFGGIFRLNLAKPSRVGIALSGAAWLDVVIGAAPAVSIDHGHGPACSGIRKIVWFNLPKGANLVQIANAPTETIRIMAIEKPAG
ncbi:hypothetical protein [Sphingobium algorifonticola]|uniref:Homogentisate 1,2-dioxygenase n=1 Tax=Sphingobium algorifonticola TaxID=2008318 RepID=A0A437J7K4_9SPHN|nr:hypothetical protein [Sphingobium algorifonticola]RVT41152.1 hypothetical protein ENE74_12020 [Sphingobium algorifonticola]